MQGQQSPDTVETDTTGTRGHTCRYFRNASGKMVHRAGCRMFRPSSVWWNWAQGKTVGEIVAESAKHGIRHQWCKRCFTKTCPTCHNQFEGRMPGYYYGSNWDWVPCQTCQGTGLDPIDGTS